MLMQRQHVMAASRYPSALAVQGNIIPRAPRSPPTRATARTPQEVQQLKDSLDQEDRFLVEQLELISRRPGIKGVMVQKDVGSPGHDVLAVANIDGNTELTATTAEDVKRNSAEAAGAQSPEVPGASTLERLPDRGGALTIVYWNTSFNEWFRLPQPRDSLLGPAELLAHLKSMCGYSQDTKIKVWAFKTLWPPTPHPQKNLLRSLQRMFVPKPKPGDAWVVLHEEWLEGKEDVDVYTAHVKASLSEAASWRVDIVKP